MHGFYGCFLQSAENFPERVAAEMQRASGPVESLTYAELRGRAESVGCWLRKSGLSEGVRCAIMASNGPLWVTAYLGIMSAGAVAVPLDTAFNQHQVNKLLWDCGAVVIFTDAQHLPVVERAIEETLVRVVMIDGSGEGRYSNLLGMFAAGAQEFKPATIGDEDLAVIMYTSGTTADPKGVMLTHHNLLSEAHSVFASLAVSEQDSILAVLPLFHALAQTANLLLPFAAGARIVYLEEMNTTELLRALSERGITFFCCVPQFFYLIHERVMQHVKSRPWAARLTFRALMALSSACKTVGTSIGKLFFDKFHRAMGRQMVKSRPWAARLTFRALMACSWAGRSVSMSLRKLVFARVHRMLGPQMRYLITGGSAFDPSIGRDLQKLGFNVLQAYGLTETSGCALLTPPDANMMGSVGKPLSGIEITIIDPQPAEGQPFPVGEVAISGGIVMKGYYHRPDATAATMSDGWLLSGDLGYMDERGNLFITGRKKEIIVLSSGKNIYPEEIEQHYLHSPLIHELCVMGLVGRAGEPISERLHAVIVPNFDVLRERKIVNTTEVIRFEVENLSVELPATKRILSFDLWRDSLPRTMTRKLKRFEIQRRVMAGGASASDSSGAVANEPTEEEAIWLADPEVQKAIRVIRQASKSSNAVVPSANLELDLGFDSMERVELVVALENELDSHADDKLIAQVYSVREMVDAVLQARNSASEPRPSLPGWEAVLATEPDDPGVIAVLNGSRVLAFAWFVFGQAVALFMRIFFRLRVSGQEKLPKKGPLILSPNHQSFLDGPVVASLIPWRLFKDMFYVGASEIFGKGPLSYLGRSFRLVPVDPDSNLVTAMRAGAFGLKQGKNLVLYPEGERSIDGVPKKFKKGAAILSTHLHVPIYPVALEGFFEAWPRGRKFPRLSRLRVRFGDPIAPPATGKNSEETYKQVTEQLRVQIVEMWESLRENEVAERSAAADLLR